MPTTHAESQLQTTDWQEESATVLDGGTSLARATANTTFSGDFDGSGAAAFLLVYPAEGVPAFVGTQAFEGTLAGRRGAFALRMDGVFRETEIEVAWSVVDGSGTGELQGLTGTGGYSARPDAPSATATLDWELPAA